MKGVNDLRDIGKIYSATDGKSIRRGDMYYIHKADEVTGSEQVGGRPAVVVGNDIGNEKSPVVIIVYATTQGKKELPTHVDIETLPQKSIVLCEQIVTVSKERLGNYAGRVTEDEMIRIDRALAVSIDLKKYKSQAEADTFDIGDSELLEKAKSKVEEIISTAKKIIQTENILLAAKNSTAICFSGDGIIKLDNVISTEQARELRDFAIRQIETGKAAGEKELEKLLGENKTIAAAEPSKEHKKQKTLPQPAKSPEKKPKLDTGKMIALRNAGWTVKDIAGELKCSEATIYNHLKKKGEE